MYTYFYIVVVCMYYMAFHLNVSLNDAQYRFLKEKGLSPSKILQEKINDIARTTEPEREDLKDFMKEDPENKHKTKWQKLNDFYLGDADKRAFGILLFGYACGQGVEDQVRKLGLSSEDMHEVQNKLKEFENEN